jgi:hypothetical protein
MIMQFWSVKFFSALCWRQIGAKHYNKPRNAICGRLNGSRLWAGRSTTSLQKRLHLYVFVRWSTLWTERSVRACAESLLREEPESRLSRRSERRYPRVALDLQTTQDVSSRHKVEER